MKRKPHNCVNSFHDYVTVKMHTVLPLCLTKLKNFHLLAYFYKEK